MMKLICMRLLAFTVAVAVVGCSNNSTDPSQNGTLKIRLTDAPGVYDAVNLTFSEISAHLDSQWVTVRSEPITVNLLEWANGKSLEIGSADVPAGRYTQIRIKIDSAEIVVDGISNQLEVPSGAQTGLKLGPAFTIAAGSTYELVIDFDAQRSIVTTGPPSNPRGYKLKPRLRVIAMAVTGSISGTVTNFANAPTAYALAESDTVTSTLVDRDTGQFSLAFLPEGIYSVAIQDTVGLSAEQNGLQVIAGRNLEIGSITLR